MKHCIGAIRARALKVIGMGFMVLAFMIGTLPFSSPAKAAGEFAGQDPFACEEGCLAYMDECLIRHKDREFRNEYCFLVVQRCRTKCFEYTSVD